MECRASPGRCLDPGLKINATGSITLLPRKRSLHTFACAQVAKTGLLHEILDLPAVLYGLFNIWRQFIWNVNRKAFLPAIARKCVATVADASPACRAVLANARALAQGNRTERDWPDSLQCTQEPLPNLFRCFVPVHRTCVILHLCCRINVYRFDTGHPCRPLLPATELTATLCVKVIGIVREAGIETNDFPALLPLYVSSSLPLYG